MRMAVYRHPMKRHRAVAEGFEHSARILVLEKPEDHVERPVRRDVGPEEVGDRSSGRGIVPAVQPQLRSRRDEVVKRAGTQPLKPSRPFRPAHCCPKRRVGNGDRLLVAEYCDCEAGVHRLVRAVQAGEGEIQLALGVAVVEPLRVG
jgi:hypothetical protein